MKILAGRWRGRSIAQPKTSTTRPLSDKVRAAIFDILGPIDGLVVLDAYAGSGAAGLEALSRGALLVEAIESNTAVARVIQSNLRTLETEAQYLLHQLPVTTWLTDPARSGRGQFDIIIADPPYARLEPDIIGQLLDNAKTGGILVLSHSSKRPAPMLESGELLRSRDYGDTSLSFYRRR